MPKTRSPLRELPFHNPGQSLDEEIIDLGDKIASYVYVSASYIGLAIFIWMIQLAKKPADPIFISVTALGVTIFSAIKIIQIRKKKNLLKMARDGEKIVGQELENLRRDGCSVFHDIQGDKFNLDHVIVSPHGIFVVETKTFSKPIKGEANVNYDGERILISGFAPDRDPLKQVEANSNWLRGVLKESTGKIFPIRGVVLFPGWFVENKEAKGSAIWVLNPKALAVFISNERTQIAEPDVHLAAYHLSRYIRTPN